MGKIIWFQAKTQYSIAPDYYQKITGSGKGKGGQFVPRLFIEREIAFDKVDQDKLIQAIHRLGEPEKVANILKSFHVNPRFRAPYIEGKSSYRKQRAGIRQGCPLISLFP